MTGEIDISTIIVGSFNTSISIIDRKNNQKISKVIEDLNNTIKQHDLIDIYRTYQPKAAENMFSLSVLCNIFQNRPIFFGH